MALQFEIMPVTPFRQNCTLLWCDETGAAVLTDVGGDVDDLLAEIRQRQLTLAAVWLTHGHLDHVGGVVALRAQLPVPVIGPHREDDFWIQQLPQSTRAYGFPFSPAFVPDRWLTEGEVLHLAGHAFQVLHIPGHTPGHVVFYQPQQHLLVAGDVLFLESIGRTDFPRGNHADLIHNIRTKILTLPPQTRVITGHGAMTTIGHEQKHNPFLV